MSFLVLLDSVLVQPLMILYSIVFMWLVDLFADPGVAVIYFSIVLSTALLPVYYQMEKSTRNALANRHAMEADIRRLKKFYTGRERYFYIQAVHRQYGYKWFTPLFSATDLYLQVFIFATVYTFLRHLSLFDGVSFLSIPDLGKPDGILWGWNLLPFLMTLINVVSASFYTTEKSKRVQAYGMAALFLVLLYSSPSCLVLYWTSNNTYSLLKNSIEFKLLPVAKKNWDWAKNDRVKNWFAEMQLSAFNRNKK